MCVFAARQRISKQILFFTQQNIAQHGTAQHSPAHRQIISTDLKKSECRFLSSLKCYKTIPPSAITQWAMPLLYTPHTQTLAHTTYLCWTENYRYCMKNDHKTNGMNNNIIHNNLYKNTYTLAANERKPNQKQQTKKQRQYNNNGINNYTIQKRNTQTWNLKYDFNSFLQLYVSSKRKTPILFVECLISIDFELSSTMQIVSYCILHVQ